MLLNLNKKRFMVSQELKEFAVQLPDGSTKNHMKINLQIGVSKVKLDYFTSAIELDTTGLLEALHEIITQAKAGYMTLEEFMEQTDSASPLLYEDGKKAFKKLNGDLFNSQDELYSILEVLKKNI
jgi:hypothetical protein